MTNSHETLKALDALIESRSILRHPFYVAWQQGELTRPQLSTYARVYWPHVAAFPSYLEAVAQLTDDPVTQTVLEENLDDELTNPRPHPEMWLDFAEDLGQTREAITRSSPHESAERMVETFTRLARRSTGRRRGGFVRIRGAAARGRPVRSGTACARSTVSTARRG